MAHLFYPIVTTFNDETQMFNGYMPDLQLLSVGRTNDEMIVEMKKLLLDYLFVVKECQTEIPSPTPMDELKQKWNEERGYSVLELRIEVDEQN